MRYCQEIVPELQGFNLLMAVDQAIEAMTDDISALQRAPLSIDQAASIYFYTMETPFYALLNTAMRSEDRNVVKPFLKFCKLFLSALYLLRLPVAAITVSRGVKAHLIDEYPKGRKFRWWQFSSSTASLDTLQSPQFCGKVGQRTVFHISTRYCVDVCKFSAMKRVEDERLILPGMQLYVKAVVNYGNDLFHIQLEEVAGTLPLLDYLHPDLVTSPHPNHNHMLAPHS